MKLYTPEINFRRMIAFAGAGFLLSSCGQGINDGKVINIGTPVTAAEQREVVRFLSPQEISDALRDCDIDISAYVAQGRFDFPVESIEQLVRYEEILSGAFQGERTYLGWHDRRAGASHVIRIESPIQLRNIYNKEAVCALVEKGLKHIDAGDMLEVEFDNLYRNYLGIDEFGFEQVLYPGGMWIPDMEAFDATSSFFDFEALVMMSPQDQLTISGRQTTTDIGLNRAAVYEAQAFIDSDVLPGGDIVSWFESQWFWDLLPEN